MLTVLVLGGYGFFGSRIAGALVADAAVRVLVGGRDRDKAAYAARTLGLPPASAVTLDARDPRLVDEFHRLGVDVVVHTAGPFQAQSYDVAQAAIAARCHYIDLADARGFVSGIERLDAEARASDVAVISGASSLPCLSSAVVDRYAPRFRTLGAIRIGIGSGARAPGLATVKGIFGYVGKPFTRLEDNAWKNTHGWMDLKRYRFPKPVGKRWMGSCDVPDLQLFPARYRAVRTVTFHAGFASDLGHLAVWTLAGLVRLRAFDDAAAWAQPLNWLSRIMEPIVSDKGAMFVALEGVGLGGAPLSLTWTLMAAQNHGPFIPCGAAIALVRKLASGQRIAAGATACVGLLSIEEYLAPLRDLDIREVLPDEEGLPAPTARTVA